MNCQGAKKRIPLFVGGELPAGQTERVRRHLEACPACRTEAEEIGRTRLAVREMARAGGAEDWSPAEWRRVIATVTKSEADRRGAPAVWKLKPVLAAGLGIFLLVAGALYLRRSSRTPEAPVVAMTAIDQEAKLGSATVAPKANPDVTSVTLVSPETGLKIIWFYNKKFEWQGFGK